MSLVSANSHQPSFSFDHRDSILGLIIETNKSKWLAHLPFTSEAAGLSLSENFLNATQTQSSCEKSKSQRFAESRGF